MKFNEQKKVITEYLRKSEKESINFLIGAELEYFIVDNKSLKSISYYGDNGIQNLLETLVNKGFQATLDDNNIVGLTNSILAITLEPGAQFEISLNPQKSLVELEHNYLQFLQILDPILKQRNQKLHSSGYHPVSKIDEIRFIPKKRYDLMWGYLKNQGEMALNMMKGTASIQVAIDYSSEMDFTQKMLLASQLTPILSSVYDNSPIFEGKKYNDFCLRTKIWNNCDNDRCGIVSKVFQKDFGYEKYAEYLLELIPIFILQNSKLIKFEKPFREIFDPTTNVESQLNHIFSMCFPDVRARNYIELRMTDSLPYPLNFAFLELVNIIFYDKNIFEKVSDLLGSITLSEINAAKEDSIKFGISAMLGDRKISKYYNEILDIIGEQKSKYFHLNSTLAKSETILRNMQ